MKAFLFFPRNTLGHVRLPPPLPDTAASRPAAIAASAATARRLITNELYMIKKALSRNAIRKQATPRPVASARSVFIPPKSCGTEIQSVPGALARPLAHGMNINEYK
ncbi:hypothetical protein EVAR_103132_1 [Eumeta japonica]|uniref:Uncharacterized protein n=1 Tax=Eumeta variegata TaxID=151549 RepID=A0A4C1X5E9_EUMVA|nr:hypothetical protein EVAR_103132_1 [Eumeta japonica]